MKFGNYLNLSSMLLVLTGFGAILITGSYTFSVLIGIATTAVYWMKGESLPKLLPVPRGVWNAVALVLLVYFAYDSFFKSLDLVGNGIKFVIYLQVVKLLSPKTNRDHLQIYLLSFLHILASTVISNDLSFSGPFLIYIVLATWTLAMFNLKLQLESSVAPEKKVAAVSGLLASKNIITKNFLGFTSLLSLTIIAFTMLVFFSFPRLSMGNFLKRVDIRRNVSGFSEEVTLGTIGTIKLNNAITLRVELAQDLIDSVDLDRLYWRGTASDHFDGHKWKQSYEGRISKRMDADSPILKVSNRQAWSGKTISYRVFMEAQNPPLLFGADELIQVSWDKPMIERIFRGSIGLVQDANAGLYFSGTNLFAADLTYTGESAIDDPPRNKLQEAKTAEFVHSYFQDYLQLPDLHPDVEKLIREIPVSQESLYEKARSVIAYLEKNYRYTLEVQDIGVEDPLRFFLIERKRGHCEYFSTALAIALRVHGIPARNVVGFRGGELNPYGGYLAVRQSDAHSWVEAYFPPVGWVRLDPSPLDSTVSTKKALFKAVNQFFDYLRLRWNKYIIEYDLRSQAQIVEKIGRSVSKWLRGAKSTDKSNEPDAVKEKTTPPMQKWVWGIMALAVLLAFSMLWRKKGIRKEDRYGSFARAIRMLKKYGFEKKPTETALEFSARVEDALGPIPHARNLTLMYYAERYGRRRVSKMGWEKELSALSTALKTRARRNQRTPWRKAA